MKWVQAGDEGDGVRDGAAVGFRGRPNFRFGHLAATANRAPKAGSLLVRLEGALQSLGIASLPEFTARSSLAAGELVTVMEDWEHVTNYAGMAWLLYPPNRFLAAKLRVWIDHLVSGLTSRQE